MSKKLKTGSFNPGLPYPSLLGGQRRCDMRGLPNTSTHDCQCGHVLPLCEGCSRTTSPGLQYPTSSVVYAIPLGRRHIRCHFHRSGEANAWPLHDSQVG